jgi:hypothetical protein
MFSNFVRSRCGSFTCGIVFISMLMLFVGIGVSAKELTFVTHASTSVEQLKRPSPKSGVNLFLQPVNYHYATLVCLSACSC